MTRYYLYIDPENENPPVELPDHEALDQALAKRDLTLYDLQYEGPVETTQKRRFTRLANSTGDIKVVIVEPHLTR